MFRPRLLLIPTSACAVLLLGADSSAPIPWPHGEAPSSTALAEAVTAAVELADRERIEEFLEAAEKGEDSEHIVVFQKDIDENNYGFGTLDRLFRFGDSFFGHEFRGSEGYGAGPTPQLRRVHTGVRGGLDTFSCAGCHSVGGVDGAGTETQNAFILGDGERLSSANVRNAPAVLGLGFVQALAFEMSSEMAYQAAEAAIEAAESGQPIEVTLAPKGVDFGELVVLPDGAWDTSAVVGVDPDLVVKPFGWKGQVSRLRRFAEDAARIHFGVQSEVLAKQYQMTPDIEKMGPGPNWFDPDNDGVYNELFEGILTASAVYMSLLESPVVLPPHDPQLRDRWANGSAVFDEIGCASCHVRVLPLLYSTWNEFPDTTGGPPVSLNLINDGDRPKSTQQVGLFSDLKRHDMGQDLADPHESPDGIGRSVFLTRPLWGLAESAPYLHDGRAATIPEAILAHGGEAQESADAFAALPKEKQQDLDLFLLSFTREPKVRVAR